MDVGIARHRHHARADRGRKHAVPSASTERIARLTFDLEPVASITACGCPDPRLAGNSRSTSRARRPSPITATVPSGTASTRRPRARPLPRTPRRLGARHLVTADSRAPTPLPGPVRSRRTPPPGSRLACHAQRSIGEASTVAVLIASLPRAGRRRYGRFDLPRPTRMRR